MKWADGWNGRTMSVRQMLSPQSTPDVVVQVLLIKRLRANADIVMKKCSYCGAEYPDDAVMCAIDHTSFETPSEPSSPPPPELKQPEYDFAPLAEGDRQKDLVTLLACRTLGEADMVVSRLRAAKIEAFLPDESLMQTVGWNFNTFGYVRVQIAPKDYDAAIDLLSRNDLTA